MDGTPLVSICCATYNHEAYIREALDGFLMQEVDFPIEILVNDDASTDGTPQILREYEQRHPDLIHVVYQEENQYSRGVRPLPQLLVPRARAKYIAVCEGDDYWLESGKLQEQVDLLEAEPEAVACFTNALKRNELTGSNELYVKNLKKGPVPISEVIRWGGGRYPTGSLLFRRDAVNYGWFDELPGMYGDEVLIFSLMASGTIYYIDQVTCVYRRWAGGVFSRIADSHREIAKKKIQYIADFDTLNDLTGNVYGRALADRISKESLYILKHLGLAEGYRYLARLRPGDGARLLNYKVKRIMNRIRSGIGVRSAVRRLMGLLN